MADLLTSIEQHANLPEEEQKHAGQAIAGAMRKEHEEFMLKLVQLADAGEINLIHPESFLTHLYTELGDAEKRKVDQALPNIVDQARHIVDFYRSTQTPNSSPQLETMVEHLWQMKERVEKECGDVFKI